MTNRKLLNKVISILVQKEVEFVHKNGNIELINPFVTQMEKEDSFCTIYTTNDSIVLNERDMDFEEFVTWAIENL